MGYSLIMIIHKLICNYDPNYRSYGRLGTNRHHWSLTDLTQEIPEEDNTTAYIRRWNR